MQISMTMPVMEPDLDSGVLRDWALAIDDGPFGSLCWGEGMAFNNPETLTLLVGTMGTKTVRSAAAWAHGLAGTTLDLDVAQQNELFDVARTAWAQAGKLKPHLASSFWFAIGSPQNARGQVYRHLRRYMNWIPAEYIDAMAPTTGFAGDEDALLALLRQFKAIGADEIQLIPTSSDIGQLRRVAEMVKEIDV